MTPAQEEAQIRANTEEIKKVRQSIAGEHRTKHINVQFLPDEDCAFVKTIKGGYFTNDPIRLLSWEAHLEGKYRHEWDDVA